MDVSSSPAGARLAATAEVALAFAVVHLGFRAFKKFTAVGQAEFALDLNLSPGIVMICVALAAIGLRRGRLADSGIALHSFEKHANVAFVAALAWSVVAALAYAGGLRLDPTWSDPVNGAVATILTAVASFWILWVVVRGAKFVERLPAWTGVGFLVLLMLLPCVARLVQSGSIGRVPGVLLSLVLGSAFGESVFFLGYAQSRLNQAFGRPWSLLGVRWGPGLLIAAGFFGLVHGLNTYDCFTGEGRFAWWWAAYAGASLSGAFLRERTGSIVAPAILHAFVDIAAFLPRMLTGP